MSDDVIQTYMLAFVLVIVPVSVSLRAKHPFVRIATRWGPVGGVLFVVLVPWGLWRACDVNESYIVDEVVSCPVIPESLAQFLLRLQMDVYFFYILLYLPAAAILWYLEAGRRLALSQPKATD